MDIDILIKLSVLVLLVAAGIWYLFKGSLLFLLWMILFALDLIYLFFVIFANISAAHVILPLMILFGLLFWANKMEKKG
tara:strand:- start:209 stop:445 length:237 start_codon:yes stop_codon:yes gene_type:complete